MTSNGIDVLHVTSAHTVLDTRIFVKQAQSLAERYNVGVLGPGDTCASWEVGGVRIETIARPRTRLGRFTWLAQALFRRIILVSPKVVHLHDPDLLMLLPRLKRLGAKVVYDAHEDFSQAPLSREWLGPIWLRRGVAHAFDKIERHYAARSDGVVVADRHLAPRFPGASVVRNFLVPDEWPHVAERKSTEVINCIYVGDITRARGALRMCDAILAAWEHGIAMKLDLVGPVAPELRAALQAHPAEPHIVLHGALCRKDVAMRMSKADVALCLPEPLPAYQTALPVKVLEYLAMKLPVVATESQRFRSEPGLAAGVSLVSPDAPAAQLASVIRSAQNLAAGARDQIRTHVLDAYSWQSERECLFALYDDLFADLEPKSMLAA